MIIAIIIAAVLILCLVGLYAAYYKVFYSPKKSDGTETRTPPALSKHKYHEVSHSKTLELSKIECEFVSIRSYDGLKLSARYIKGDDSKPLCILFHGYHGSPLRDFSGLATYLHSKRYNLILIEERAHWRSQGHTITFGIRERYDVVSWVDYANGRFGKDKPIFLFGISLGGGTVLMASGQKLPDNVKGIVADCPFNSPKDIIKHVCRKIGVDPDLCWPIVWLSAVIYGHFNISATTAAREAAKTKKPIMLIHGEGDDFVPAYMSKEVRDANPSMIELHTVAEAGHGLSYYYETERYESLIDDFITRSLSNNTSL